MESVRGNGGFKSRSFQSAAKRRFRLRLGADEYYSAQFPRRVVRRFLCACARASGSQVQGPTGNRHDRICVDSFKFSLFQKFILLMPFVRNMWGLQVHPVCSIYSVNLRNFCFHDNEILLFASTLGVYTHKGVFK